MHGKKILSICIYGNREMDYVGLKENLGLLPVIYPEMEARLYAHTSSDMKRIQNIVHDSPVVCEVAPVDASHGKKSTQVYRFMPLEDPGVSLFISRDLDSRINYRERAAFDQWIASGKSLHVMRDHPCHVKCPIMAGMCGFIVKKTLPVSRFIRECGGINKRGDEPKFLTKYIYPHFKTDYIAHESSKNVVGQNAIPFPPHKPLLFNGHFVGEVYDADNNPVPAP